MSDPLLALAGPRGWDEAVCVVRNRRNRLRTPRHAVKDELRRAESDPAATRQELP